MNFRKKLLVFASFFAIAGATAALAASYAYRDASGAVYNMWMWASCPAAGTYCSGVVLTDSSANEKGTAGNPLSTKSGLYVSAGAQQNGISIGTNTQLTVPSGATCAFITIEGANVRRTSDGTSPTSSMGR